ncbi:MAG: response regulator [Magnetococcales bacterium]|nr:response regulator [Magnetococcales bacterium]
MNTNELPRILIVDDTPANLHAFSRLLSRLPADIVTAPSGNAALREIARHSIALLLLDVDMPEMDGYEVARMLKEVDTTADIPIIFITAAYRDDQHQLRGYHSGGIDYVEKPINDEILLAKVSVFLELFRQRDEIKRLNAQLVERVGELERTRSLLQLSEERFRGLVNNLPAIVFRCQMDRDWTMIYISDMVEAITGYPPSDFIDNRVRSFASIIHPDDTQHVEETIALQIRRRQPYEIEYRLIDSSGKIHWVHEQGQGIDYEDGKPRWLDGALFDTTARKTAERERIKFQRAVEQAPASVVITDLDGKIEYVNPRFCQVTGYTPEEVIGQNPRVLQSGQTEKKLYDDLWNNLTHNQEWQGEFLNKKKDGTLYWELATIHPVRMDPNGPVSHYIGVKEDITARKEVERSLEEARLNAEGANRAKSEFLAVMSHEIRTPMNAIVGMADQLAEMNLPPDGKRYLEIIQRNSHNLLVLINDILDLSRIEAGRMHLERKPFDLKKLLDTVIEEFLPRAHRKNLDLTWMIDSRLIPYRKGDPQRLRQVLDNLLGNAIKFTREGRIGLSVTMVHERGERLRFSVSDTGIGIPSAQQEHIFAAFTQADSSTTREFGGTGLGLAICKRLIDKMEGELSVESRVGKGSLFSFILPLELIAPEALEGKDHGSAMPREKEADPRPVRPLRILLAEDVEDSIAIIQSFVEPTPHQLEVVENGQQVVQRVQSGRFDLVLMDIQLPLMDGLEATRMIRRWERENNRRPLPIMALTANALIGEAKKSRTAGCDAHLTKPLRKSEFMDLLLRITRNLEEGHAVAERECAATGERSNGSKPPPRECFRINRQRWQVMKQDMGPNISRMVGRFLLRLPERIEVIAQHLTRRRFDQVAEECHKLKGALATMGAERMEDICANMEQMAREETMSSLEPTMERLRIEGRETARELERLIAAETTPSTTSVATTDHEPTTTMAGLPVLSVAPQDSNLLAEPVSPTPSPPDGDDLPLLVVNSGKLAQLSQDMGGSIGILLEKFLETLPGRIAAITHALREHDHPSLTLEAHRLKGSALSIGAESLAHLCLGLEKMGRNKDTPKDLEANRWIEALDNRAKALAEVLESERKRLADQEKGMVT